MDKQQQEEVRNELRSLFQHKYNPAKWKQVLIDFFGATEIRNEHRELTTEHNEKVAGYELGKLHLPGYEVGLYEFEIKSSYRIGLNRVGLRSLVKSYTNYEVDAALVVYYDENEWRLSFICNLRDEKTAPKRFTYLLGHAHETYRTPIDRFLLLKENGVTFENIYEAFSVEKLNTDFFNGYKNQFKKFCAHIGGQEKWQRDYVKKLLGRLVFLQFLQKKGWMGVPDNGKKWVGGDPNYMRTLLDRHKDNDRLLTDVLEPLFFETLNRERKNDLVDPVLGDQIRIPYLNGGLFDRDELDKKQIDFPYAFFDELTEFFSQFNFTIDENDPDDSEVGIDPEMLGHIFENLLEDNKDKGTFYTPKEIVQYMSRESLIQYLRTHTDKSIHGAIDHLIQTGEVDLAIQNRKIAEQLNNLLKAVKVCDPAIGSGAFPMGVLSEIFKCRRVLYGFMKKAEAFSPSLVKREIIQENIYGVDIEQGAVDIARLRFWLSLVVDEEQPQPLPNLDYKIMQGNSLLESFEGIDLSKFTDSSQDNDKLFGSLFEARTRQAIEPLIKRHFSETDHPAKEQIRAEIDGIIRQHIKDSLDRRERELQASLEYHRKAMEGNQEFIDNPATTPGNRRKYEKNLRLETYQFNLTKAELDKVAASRVHIGQVERTNKPFFLWHLYFKDVFDRGGFDIVIANPPYVLISKGEYASRYSNFYDYQSGKIDLYRLFVEWGTKKLMNPQTGNLIFIIPNTILTIPSCQPLRDYLLQKQILSIVNYDESVFENVSVNSIILHIGSNHGGEAIKIYTKGLNPEHVSYLEIEPSGLDNKINIFIDNDKHTVLEKLKSIPQLSSVEDIELCLGIQAYHNTIHTKEQIKTRFLHSNIRLSESYQPEYSGRHIQKYRFCPSSVVYVDYSQELYTKPDIKFFEDERILIREIVGDTLVCTYVNDPFIVNKSCYVLKSESVDYKYLLGLLNSKLIAFFIKNKGDKAKQTLFPRVSMTTLKSLPFLELEFDAQQPFINLVDQILELKKADPAADTSALEAEIDRMVYELYGLTPAEIDVVEGRTPPTEPSNDQPMSKEYDFFISHASEDKQDVVRKLAKALQKAGCKVWYDEFELKIGDSLRTKIDHGLANSRYGIVVISRNFISKNWPAYEFNGMMAREIDGVKVILPLWHGVTKDEVVAFSPTLADKMALDTGKYDISEIVDKLKEVLEECAVVEHA